jgi:DNA repair exonuclease SbcCD ATPase subunit
MEPEKELAKEKEKLRKLDENLDQDLDQIWYLKDKIQNLEDLIVKIRAEYIDLNTKFYITPANATSNGLRANEKKWAKKLRKEMGEEIRRILNSSMCCEHIKYLCRVLH